ncbi:MAG: carbohydrate-binding family 9-like protein [Oscillospiraceae bacterium]
MSEIIKLGKHPETLFIEHYRWLPPGPEAWADLSIDGNYLGVCLTAIESPLLAARSLDDEDVYQDSCLEFFFRPEGDDRYINIECNPLGAMIIGFGESRHDRVSLLDEYKHLLSPTVEIHPAQGKWSVLYHIPFPLLEETYGRPFPRTFYANFYKCGGLSPHYGMWREVDAPEPDFHRPEFFGKFEITI